MAPAHGDAALALRAAGSGGRVAVDVLDELGATLGPVGFPQLLAVICVPSPDARRSRGSGHGVFGPRRARAGDDVPDQRGAGLRAVTPPQLLAVAGGGGREEDPLSTFLGERHFVVHPRTSLRVLHVL